MDDNDDWFGGGDDEPAAEPQAPAAAAAAVGGAEKPAESEEAAGEAGAAGEAPPEEEEPEEGEYLDPEKFLLFKHWIRPKFLPYKYLTEYRLNYYNDVIDYLDKRNRGIGRERPVPQTWAERVLRTYVSKLDKIECYRRKLEEVKVVDEKEKKGLFQLHHSKNYTHRKYYSILY